MLRDGLVNSLEVLLLAVFPPKGNLGGFANHLLPLMGTLGLVDRLKQGLRASQALTGCEFSFLISWGPWCSN